MMKAIAFDLGDTLVEYEGLPLSWVEHYPEALGQLAAFWGVTADSKQISHACDVLRKYNTRLNPRIVEYPFAVIMEELLPCFHVSQGADELGCAQAFFQVFRQRLRCFPDSRDVLEALRRKGLKIGIFTDVPYGMPRELVLDDVREAALGTLFDVLLTSRDVGYRKPSVEALRTLGLKLGCEAYEMAYVGNEKKDVEVARAWGCRAILIDRLHCGHLWGQDRTIASLVELLDEAG